MVIGRSRQTCLAQAADLCSKYSTEGGMLPAMDRAGPGGAQGVEQWSHSTPAYGVTGLNVCKYRLRCFLSSTEEERPASCLCLYGLILSTSLTF